MTESLRVSRVAAPIRQQAAQNLRNAILEGRLRPGQRLVERELCEVMEVSRTSIREALRQLESEGLVVNVPYRGPVVRKLTRREAENIYQIRGVLEALAARLFVANASDADVAALEQAMDALEEACRTGTPRDLVKLKDEFYEILLRGCGNETVYELLNTLHARVALLRATSLGRPGRPVESVKEIRDIVSAIKGRDGELAARACERHVENAASVAIEALYENEDGDESESPGDAGPR